MVEFEKVKNSKNILKNKLFYVFIIIGLVVIIVLWVFLRNLNSSVDNLKLTTEQEESLKRYVRDSFLHSDDYLECSSIIYENDSYCYQLNESTNVSGRKECLINFNLFMAIQKNDVSYCKKIPTRVSILCEGIITNDPSKCSSITDTEINTECKDIINSFYNDLDLDKLDKQLLVHYYLLKAIKTGDISYCDKISSETYDKFAYRYKIYCKAALLKKTFDCRKNLIDAYIAEACNNKEVIPSELNDYCVDKLTKDLTTELVKQN